MSNQKHDAQAIISALSILAPSGVVELRALDCEPSSGYDRTVSGYFDADHHEDLTRAVERMCGSAAGVYVTLQEVAPDCLARATNRARPIKKKDPLTSDADIAAYRWLPLDFDPLRTKGVSSSDEELARAHDAAAVVYRGLTADGWPEPVYATSGNGAHLLYRLPLGWAGPRDGERVQAVIASIIDRFKGDCEGVDLDAKVFNPSRIWKLYGTVARKGDATEARPHRLAKILSAPEDVETVPVALLDAAAEEGARVLAPAPKATRIGVLAALTPSQPIARASSAPAAPRQSAALAASPVWIASEDTQEKVEGALAYIPADDRDIWLAVGGALHHWGDPSARSMWDAWSASSSKCDPKVQDKTWAGFGSNARSPKTLGTLYRLAQESGWEHPALKIKRERSAAPASRAKVVDMAGHAVAADHKPPAQARVAAALADLKAIKESEGLASPTFAQTFSDVADLIREVWRNLDTLEKVSPASVLAALAPLAPAEIPVWQRRCERAVKWAERQVTRAGWRTEDDLAADYLRAAGGGAEIIETLLAVHEEPWWVAMEWAMEGADEAEQAVRADAIRHILSAHGEFLKGPRVKAALGALALPAVVAAAFPASMRPKAAKPAKAAKAGGILDLLPGAPLNEATVIPRGWAIRAGGVGKLSTDPETGAEVFDCIIRHAIVIVAGQEDTTGERWVTLAWRHWGDWRTRSVPRAVICDRNKLLAELPSHGATINSVNALDAVEWLCAFEAANDDLLPRSKVSSQMGWQGAGERRGFLLGEVWVGADGEVIAKADDPTTWQEGAWALACTTGEDLRDARRFGVAEGTMEGWAATVAEVAEFPRVMLALYATLAAPLIEILGVRSPIVDWSGPPGTGKTSTLHLAASVWGHPDEFGRGVMGSWYGTLVGHERRAAMLGNLPIMLNDSNKADKWVPGKVIYELAEGTGKQRGAAGGGRQAVQRWSTVALSTGEQRLIDLADAKDAGTAHRVISLHGSPWGGWQGDKVERMKEGLGLNHGHIGRTWVKALVSSVHEKAQRWKERHVEIKRSFMAAAPGNAAAHRFAEDFAVFVLAAELAHQVFGEEWSWSVEQAREQIRGVFLDIAAGAVGLTAWEKAVGMAWDYAVRHPDHFYGRRKGRVDAEGKTHDPEPPHGGWAGSWSEGQGWSEIGFIPEVLDDLFEKKGLMLDSIERDWKQQGVVRQTSEKGNNKPKVTMGKERPRMVVLLRSAIRRICLGEGSDG